jgi:hypothetical protein
MIAVAEVQHQLMGAANLTGSFWFKAQLLNLRGVTAFMDSDLAVEHVVRCGVPICLRPMIEVLPGDTTDTFVEVGAVDEELVTAHFRGAHQVPSGIQMFSYLLPALGFPSWLQAGDDPSGSYFSQLAQAGMRAEKVGNTRKWRSL